MVRIMTKETMMAIVVYTIMPHLLIFSPADDADTDDTYVGDSGDGEWLQILRYICNLSMTMNLPWI